MSPAACDPAMQAGEGGQARYQACMASKYGDLWFAAPERTVDIAWEERLRADIRNKEAAAEREKDSREEAAQAAKVYAEEREYEECLARTGPKDMEGKHQCLKRYLEGN
ncbi:MAG TPA: hypothetical protein VFG53_01515 [Anaeromyxobacter sp.]|nr:hypothetical protein [Anaeromyxobacter sp.]